MTDERWDKLDARLWSRVAWDASADNTADRVAKGRNADQSGERSHQAKLTPKIVREVRASNESQYALGRKYGVSGEAIRLARRGDTWRAA